VTDAIHIFSHPAAIRMRLAKADPNNADWQRNLSLDYIKVGDALAAQDNFSEALKSYRDSLAIKQRLAKVDPNNARWQHDLSNSYNRVAKALMAQGNLTDAGKFFSHGLDIAKWLTSTDADKENDQLLLATSYEGLGDVNMGRKETDEAKAASERALAIYSKLIQRFPDDTTVLSSSTVPLMRLGELYGRDGRAYLQKALAILRQLDEAGRLEAQHKSSITWIEAELAKLQKAEAPPK